MKNLTKSFVLPFFMFVFALMVSNKSYSQALNWTKYLVPSVNNSTLGFTFYIREQDFHPIYGYAVVGNFKDTVDMDPSSAVSNMIQDPSSIGQWEAFVAYYDIYGNFIWSKNLLDVISASLAQENTIDVKFDHSGNLIVVSNTNVYQPSVLRMRKFNSTGVLLWVKDLPNVGPNVQTSQTGITSNFDIDEDNNIYIHNRTNGSSGLTIDNLSIPPSVNNYYIHYLVKLNPLGVAVWLNKVSEPTSSAGNIVPKSILCLESNNLLVSMVVSNGQFDLTPYNTTTIFGSSTTHERLDQVLDTAGNVIQTNNLGVCHPVTRYYSVSTSTGEYYCLHEANDTNYISKYSNNGVSLWSHPYYTYNETGVVDIQVDQMDNLFLAGAVIFNSPPLDMDPGPGILMYPAGSFLVAFNSTGQFLKIVSPPPYAYMNNFDVGTDNSIYFATNANASTPPRLHNMSMDSCALIIGNSIVSFSNPDCSQGGQIILNPIGGSAPYSYVWSNGLTGNDTVNIINPGIYEVVVQENGGCTDTMGFLVEAPSTSCIDIAVYAVALFDNFIPGQSTNIMFNTVNNGCTSASGTTKIVLDPVVTFISSVPSPSSVNGDTLLYDFTNLVYGSNGFVVDMTLFTNMSAILGTPIEIEMTSDTLLCDSIFSNNTFNYSSVVLTSYDPNDLTVFPKGVCEEKYISPDQKLTYLVRFQNTGTSPAIKIKILDSLDLNLNLSTAHIISSSHDMYTEVLSGNVLQFVFDNINLPDSNSNEMESHGYVLFDIDPITPLFSGIQIENRVGIYFDFNSPVYTNTESNTIYEGDLTIPPCELSLSENSKKYTLNIFPNPAQNEIYFLVNGVLNENAIVEIIDINGRTILKGNANTNFMDIRDINNGIYFLRLYENSAVWTTRFIKS